MFDTFIMCEFVLCVCVCVCVFVCVCMCTCVICHLFSEPNGSFTMETCSRLYFHNFTTDSNGPSMPDNDSKSYLH